MGRQKSRRFNIERKSKFLGICISRARRILVNKIIYKFFSGQDETPFCYRCGEAIVGEFHIDHKEPWFERTDGFNKYFDLSNLALSHPLCNSLSRRWSTQRTVKNRVVNQSLNRAKWNKTHYAKKKLLQNE